MFNLDKVIAQWRQNLAARITKPEILDELESHLRDDVRAQMESGSDPQAACQSAVQRIGEAAALEAEFSKISQKTSANPARVAAKMAILFGGFTIASAMLLSLVSALGWHHFDYGLLLAMVGAGLVLALLFACRRRYAWPFGYDLLELHVSAEMYAPETKLILECAGQEARLLNHNYVGTEHVLLGLINTGGAEITTLFDKLGVSQETISAAIKQKISRGAAFADKRTPLTPRLKRALLLAVEETKASRHAKVGPAHLLLGLLCEGDGVAGRVLRELGLEISRTRQSCQ